MRKVKISTHDSLIPISLIVLCCSLLVLVIVILLMMRPVADDYAYFSDALINNPIKFAIHYYLDWTGRSMQALWMASLYKIFGNDVVIYGGIVQLVLLVSSALFCSYAMLKQKVSNHLWIISIGLIGALFSVYMSPSLFDTNLWITSSSVYLGSMIAFFTALGFAFFALNSNHLRWWHIFALVVVIFLAQLFSEPTSIIMIYLGIIAVILAHFIIRHKKNFCTIAWSWLLASIAGFLFMYLSPGTNTRQGELQIQTSPHELILGAVNDLSKLTYIFTSYRVWLIVLVGTAIAVLLAKATTKQRFYTIAIATTSALAIPLSLFIATRYTMGDYAPLRAFSVPTTLFGLCLAVIIGVIVAFFISPTKRTSSRWINPTFIFATMLIGLYLITSSLPTLQAVAIRANLYDNRDRSIKEQLASQQAIIHITPLPVLLDNTDAIDLYYNANTPDWLSDAFRDYYSIPSNVSITFEAQPEGYCVQYRNPVWFGTKTCKELDQ